MKILLDTHVFLWYISGDSKLPLAYRDAVRDPFNDVFLSTASVWEAAIKDQLGKLSLPAPAAIYLPQQRIKHGIESFSIEECVLPALASLPLIHRDPFDRILIAQTNHYGLTLASVDPEVRAYSVSILPTN